MNRDGGAAKPRGPRAVLITGASSGIGAEVARRAAASGYRVIGLGRDQERIEQLVGALPGTGHEALSVDLRQPDCWAPIDARVKAAPDLYGLVHCAGTQIIKPLRVTRPADYRDMYEIHVVAAAELMRRVSAKIGRNSSGSFVLVSSVAGSRGGAGVTPYAAAKAALAALARGAALELASQRIRVNVLVPGMVETPMSDALLDRLPEEKRDSVRLEHPLGIGQPAQVADAAMFLLGDESGWITGSSISVDGGFLAR